MVSYQDNGPLGNAYKKPSHLVNDKNKTKKTTCKEDNPTMVVDKNVYVISPVKTTRELFFNINQ